MRHTHSPPWAFRSCCLLPTAWPATASMQQAGKILPALKHGLAAQMIALSSETAGRQGRFLCTAQEKKSLRVTKQHAPESAGGSGGSIRRVMGSCLYPMCSYASATEARPGIKSSKRRLQGNAAPKPKQAYLLFHSCSKSIKELSSYLAASRFQKES